jgi:hypothetical protein
MALAVDHNMGKRVSIELNSEEWGRFERLRDRLHVRSPDDVLALGLLMLDWAVDRARRGEHIASMSPNFDQYRRFPVPDIERVRDEADV